MASSRQIDILDKIWQVFLSLHNVFFVEFIDFDLYGLKSFF